MYIFSLLRSKVIANEDRPAFFAGAAQLICSMTTESAEGVFVANVSDEQSDVMHPLSFLAMVK